MLLGKKNDPKATSAPPIILNNPLSSLSFRSFQISEMMDWNCTTDFGFKLGLHKNVEYMVSADGLDYSWRIFIQFSPEMLDEYDDIRKNKTPAATRQFRTINGATVHRINFRTLEIMLHTLPLDCSVMAPKMVEMRFAHDTDKNNRAFITEDWKNRLRGTDTWEYAEEQACILIDIVLETLTNSDKGKELLADLEAADMSVVYTDKELEWADITKPLKIKFKDYTFESIQSLSYVFFGLRNPYTDEENLKIFSGLDAKAAKKKAASMRIWMNECSLKPAFQAAFDMYPEYKEQLMSTGFRRIIHNSEDETLGINSKHLGLNLVGCVLHDIRDGEYFRRDSIKHAAVEFIRNFSSNVDAIDFINKNVDEGTLSNFDPYMYEQEEDFY